MRPFPLLFLLQFFFDPPSFFLPPIFFSSHSIFLFSLSSSAWRATWRDWRPLRPAVHSSVPPRRGPATRTPRLSRQVPSTVRTPPLPVLATLSSWRHFSVFIITLLISEKIPIASASVMSISCTYAESSSEYSQ